MMARVIICDKCGMNSVDTSDFMHLRAHELTDNESIKLFAENHMEVCKECYKKIFKEVLEYGN